MLLNSQVPCSTPFLSQSPVGEVRKSTQNFFLFHHPLSSRNGVPRQTMLHLTACSFTIK